MDHPDEAPRDRPLNYRTAISDRCTLPRNFLVYLVFRSLGRSLPYYFRDTPTGASSGLADTPGTYNYSNPGW
jgi:hypothetical protein